MQPQYIMTYDQESGVKAGGGEYVMEGGAYICEILSAKFVEANTGSNGIEFSIKTDEGLKSDFLTVYYMKKNKDPTTGGQSCINAMMGILKLPGFTFSQSGNDYVSPEFKGKRIGLFLQKTLYKKQDGSDGFKFDIRVPFHPESRKTLKELISGSNAETIERMTNNYKDKIETSNSQSFNSASQQHQHDPYNW